MAKLLRRRPANEYYGEREYWLIGDRFELITSIFNKKYTFFIEDRTGQLLALKLIPKMGEDLGLFKQPNITLAPSIDTCGINLPASRYDELFKLIENYLLKL